MEHQPLTYTWDDMARDLALLTPLTLDEAAHVAYDLKDTGLLQPSDVLTPLKRMFGSNDVRMRSGAMRELLLQTAWPNDQSP